MKKIKKIIIAAIVSVAYFTLMCYLANQEGRLKTAFTLRDIISYLCIGAFSVVCSYFFILLIITSKEKLFKYKFLKVVIGLILSFFLIVFVGSLTTDLMGIVPHNIYYMPSYVTQLRKNVFCFGYFWVFIITFIALLTGEKKKSFFAII